MKAITNKIPQKEMREKRCFYIKREWLIAYRKSKGLTQQEIADALEINQSTYAAYETGNKRPSPKIAKKLSKVFGFDWTKFFEED